jgi:MoxR-like ATPase
MNPSELRGTRRLPSAVKDRIKVWIQLGYPKKSIEQQIVVANCPEYHLSSSHIELILQLVQESREDPAVETPASIRTSIGMARLAGERAKRLGKSVDNRILAEACQLTLREAIRLKPGRDIEGYIDKLLKRVLGTA